jgi:hypothetical protein
VKAGTLESFSDQVDTNLAQRLRELSDLKKAIEDADPTKRSVLLKALVALSYSHWEGFAKFAATKYLEFLTSRRLKYSELKRGFYASSFVVRLGSFTFSKPSIEARYELVSQILDSEQSRFAFVHPDLVNTGSNLNFTVLRQICLICDIDFKKFRDSENFIDVILLKRRNSIAHGDDSIVGFTEMDELIESTIKLMRLFKNELENKLYIRAYLRE